MLCSLVCGSGRSQPDDGKICHLPIVFANAKIPLLTLGPTDPALSYYGFAVLHSDESKILVFVAVKLDSDLRAKATIRFPGLPRRENRPPKRPTHIHHKNAL